MENSLGEIMLMAYKFCATIAQIPNDLADANGN